MGVINDFFNKPRIVVQLADSSKVTSTTDPNGQLVHSIVIVPDVEFMFRAYIFDALFVNTVSSVQAQLRKTSGRTVTMLTTPVTVTDSDSHFFQFVGTVASGDWDGTTSLDLILTVTDNTARKHVVEIQLLKA